MKIDLRKVRADMAKASRPPARVIRLAGEATVEVVIAPALRQDRPDGVVEYQCDWRGDQEALTPEIEAAVLALFQAIADSPRLGGARIALHREERR